MLARAIDHGEPAGNRGVTLSATNDAHSASLTSPPPGFSRPKYRFTSSAGTSGAMQAEVAGWIAG